MDIGIEVLCLQDSYRIAVFVRTCSFAPQEGREISEVTKSSSARPRFVRFELQLVDHRSADFHHQVVPVMAIFSTDIHAADESQFLIDDRGFRVVAGDYPGVGDAAHANVRLIFQIDAHRQWRFMIVWHRLRIGLQGHHVAQTVDHDANTKIFSALLECVSKFNRVVVVIKDVRANINAFRGLFDCGCEAAKVLIAIDKEFDATGIAACTGYPVQFFFKRTEIHGF